MSRRRGPLTLLRRWLSGAHDADCADPSLCRGPTHGPCTRYTAVWRTEANDEYLGADSETRRCVDEVVRQLVVRPEAVRATWSPTRGCWTAVLVTGRGVGQLDYAFEPEADHVVVTRLAV